MNERDFIAGRLSLDLINTVGYRASPDRSYERLGSKLALRRWVRAARTRYAPAWGISDAWRGIAEVAPEPVRQLRETLHAALDPNCVPSSRISAVAEIEKKFHQGSALKQLLFRDSEFAWHTRPDAAPLERFGLPLLEDAIDLLVSRQWTKIRTCAGLDCGWVFLDTSRTGGRRWCRMQDCGNRHKAREHYRKYRTAGV